jgi:glutaryl-CoA dehydrogenase
MPTPTDFYDIDSVLAEEERAVRDSVRQFVNDKVLPIIGKCYVDGRFPKELIPEMASLGVLGANLPEEYGCAGLNNVAYGLIMQELERGDSGIRSFASVQGALVMYPIYAFGSDEQKLKWLPALAKGEAIGCFGLTEPDYGSNPAGMVTMAREQNDGTWVLNGGKMWITNGSQANVAVVWAKTNGDKSDKSIRGFVVPTVPRIRVSSSFRTYASAPTRFSRSREGSRARSCASRRRAMAFRGARSARPWRATRKRSRTRGTASCSTNRSPRSSCSRRAWPRW